MSATSRHHRRRVPPADRYAAASGLVERSAAAPGGPAFPTTPPTTATFGPGQRGPGGAKPRPVRHQSPGCGPCSSRPLHPAGHGPASTSTAPGARIRSAGLGRHPPGTLATVTFGDKGGGPIQVARRASAASMTNVQGTDPVTGQPYAAGDPRACCSGCTPDWSTPWLAAHHLYGAPASSPRRTADRYVEEMAIRRRTAGRAPPARVPRSTRPRWDAYPGVPSRPRAALHPQPPAESMGLPARPPPGPGRGRRRDLAGSPRRRPSAPCRRGPREL